MKELNTLSIVSAAEGLRGGDFSPLELTESVIAAIRAKDDTIGAYLTVDEESALAAAREAKPSADAPLAGIPIAIKDLINVRGQPCTCGSKILQGYVSPFDATVIERLRNAGMIFLGRVNMDEFAMGSSTENSAYKVTRNPRDLTKVPGGSSGGSAAAVAADEAICALGTDTGGSIRQPASFCGIVGFKPSYGRVSRYGVTAFASSLDQVGPMTKNVTDAALLMNVLAGQDPRDGTTPAIPVPDYVEAAERGTLKGLRIGLPKEYFVDGVQPAVRAAVQRAIDICAKEGAEIFEVSLPHTEYAMAVYYICAPAEASANLARFDGVRYGARKNNDVTATRSAGFGAEVKRRIMLGTYVLSRGYYDAYYGRAQRVRTLIRRDFDKAFAKCDVLMTPVAPTEPYAIGSQVSDPLQMYLGDVFTIPAALAGLCAVSVPVTPTIGVQLIGAPFSEAKLFGAARAFEKKVC